ncbi:GGDEF domain-containing protein [Devosia beringensis]|uniref:GGDEF domain-containing protein n=1 Tax=Devosia beringensis TaxID=2657486 RepID=UPI00186B7C14|nr:GGDEF domain-containing protein [Devosia beringensis]
MNATTEHDYARLQEMHDEPYERQLAQGFARLCFAPALEAEYRAAFAQEQRRPALIFGGVALTIWAGFAGFDLLRLDVLNKGVPSADLWVLLCSRWAALFAIAAFYVSPLRARARLEPAAFAIYSLMALVAAMNAVIYKAHGIPAAESALVIVVMAPFLPIGMTFYRSLMASFVPVVVAAIAGAILLQDNNIRGLPGMIFVLALAIPVGAIGGYMRELAHRRQFLLTAMLSRQAQFDPLTNLANRRLFQRHAEAAIAHANRNGETLVLAMLDIDHFKNFNDRCGHAAGDQALRRVADAIASVARQPMDMATRLGGEEFALLLHGSDLGSASPVLEALRAQISALAVPTGTPPLTISIGATSPVGTESLSEVYERADRLLYAAKSSGRDRLATDMLLQATG